MDEALLNLWQTETDEKPPSPSSADDQGGLRAFVTRINASIVG